MTLLVRHAGRFLADQVRYAVRTGAWWIPLALVILGLGIALAATAQTVVPHAVYVLF